MIYIHEPALPADAASEFRWRGPGIICLCGTRAYRVAMAIDPTDTLNYDRERLIQEQDQ